MGNYRFISRINGWTAGKEKDADFVVLDMVTDIHRTASMIAPKESRALVKSGRISREGNAHYKVIFGGGAVPYAKRRHFENKKTPESLGYLERAGDTTSRNLRRYAKGMQ